MKINNLKHLALLVLPMLLFSCSKENGSGLRAKGEGVLDLHFGYDVTAVPMSKADGDPIFAITVKNFATGVIVKQVEDHNTLATSPMTLKAGKYIVIASNGSNLDAGFDTPYYEGKDTVEMVSGKTTNSSFECTLANVKVAVAMSEAVTSNFKTYDVTIDNGAGGVITFDKDHLSSFGYVKCTGTLKWTIKLVNTDGEEKSISNTISNVKPREYYRICFDVNGNSGFDQGGATLRVSYDSSVNVKEYGIDISLNKKSMPSLSEATGADITTTLTAPQNAGVLGLFNITAMAGIKDISISHSETEFSSIGIPTSFSFTSNPSGLQNFGVVCSSFEAGVSSSATLDMRTFFATKLPIGKYSFIVSVLDNQSQYLNTTIMVKIIPDVEISIINVAGWGRYAEVNAQYNTDEQPAGMAFRYKKSSDSDWITYTGALTISGTKYSAKITGLEPYVSYDFQAVSTKDVSDDNIMSAKIFGTTVLPNMNFDSWSQSSGIWYPDADANDLFWDSANPGLDILSATTTSPESSIVHTEGGKAARLETLVKASKLAAGNIFTGAFRELDLNTLSATVDFGRPYTDKPRQLKGFYNYIPASINKVDSNHSSLSGQSDYCQIYICLTDWSAPLAVNSAAQNFINPNADYIIAYGQISDNTNTGGYKEFTIDLEYRNDKTPTYIVVVAAASKYGDYFTGGKGSLLYLDDFSFVF